ncbi:MAG: Iron-sulfur flavoprotein [Methanosaeta sp. PtaB.Bin039]|nr:MAG: Iron-sulfur flavoprotein [Methanosaeta sp. PtaB.Bin039]OPY47233.1 MAG: Iron-sulfur flavoprotein [Methanosaeta sp. PtaU1.Bin028]HOT06327.1 flavodoxin family protein [Methanotrichaceae archaeon]HQF15766.1 flavodoxin family protein [Methanotrichaceae archaeon]HQI90560.1 flavodoxin family protein [Methanotrichaceae archaeon]
MKAIGIVGSPRRNGNVDTLVQAVLDGAEEAGYQTTKYHLNDMRYSGCQACNYCKSHENCRLDDDLSGLLSAISNADAVVFGSPIYFFQFTGQFRLMVDRMYSLIDEEFKSRLSPGKKAVIVTSQGDPDPDAYDNVPREFAKALSLLGFEVIDTIKMVSGIAPDDVKGRGDLLEKAREAGRSL